MIGLKRGAVALEEHQDCWDESAAETVAVLWEVLKDRAIDIQHVGSTSIKQICAKPIIDIAVGLQDLSSVEQVIPLLEEKHIVFRGTDYPEQFLFVKGDFARDIRTHHIHMVMWDSVQWNDYIDFRDYLNADSEKAKEYEGLKLQLAQKYFNDRNAYTTGKKELIERLLQEAKVWRTQHG
ncbi:MAG: GrpB family protein [Clostridiales bacterium]|nr:GrpB family protein [Clostridiales bacterium]